MLYIKYMSLLHTFYYSGGSETFRRKKRQYLEAGAKHTQYFDFSEKNNNMKLKKNWPIDGNPQSAYL